MLLALKSSNRPNAGLSGACQRLISRLPVPLDYAESRMPCPDLTFCEGWREAHIQMGLRRTRLPCSRYLITRAIRQKCLQIPPNYNGSLELTLVHSEGPQEPSWPVMTRRDWICNGYRRATRQG